MEVEKLIKLLGLEEGATEEDVLARLAEVMEAAKKAQEKDPAKDPSKDPTKDPEKNPDGKEETQMVANKTVLELLGLPQTAKTEDVTAKIMAFKAGDPALKARVEQLEKQAAQRDADELVEMALKEGKINAAQKDWATTYALSDPAGFKAFSDKAPIVVPVGKLSYPSDVRGKQPEVDMKILKNLGVSAEDLKKYGGRDDE